MINSLSATRDRFRFIMNTHTDLKILEEKLSLSNKILTQADMFHAMLERLYREQRNDDPIWELVKEMI